MKLDKRLVDEVIRLTKKYYRTRDADNLPALHKAEEVLKENATWQVVNLIEDLAAYTQKSGKGTYDDIYKALAVFGIIVEELENEKAQKQEKMLAELKDIFNRHMARLDNMRVWYNLQISENSVLNDIEKLIKELENDKVYNSK